MGLVSGSGWSAACAPVNAKAKTGASLSDNFIAFSSCSNGACSMFDESDVARAACGKSRAADAGDIEKQQASSRNVCCLAVAQTDGFAHGVGDDVRAIECHVVGRMGD